MAGRQSSSVRNQNAAPAVFSKSGAVSAAALPDIFVNPYDVPLRVREVVLSAGTAPTGDSLTVDVKIGGTSVFAAAADRAAIAATKKTGRATPTKELGSIILKPGEQLTAEVTKVGSSVAGSDLRVHVLFA